MSRRDDRVELIQMLHYARKAVTFAAPFTEDTFLQDEVRQLALWKLVEIVGEAATRVSDAGRAKIPGVPWNDIIGMRNHLAHGYDIVDLPTLWDTVRDDLPPLIAILEVALSPDES